jgi:hypothetical protein
MLFGTASVNASQRRDGCVNRIFVKELVAAEPGKKRRVYVAAPADCTFGES